MVRIVWDSLPFRQRGFRSVSQCAEDVQILRNIAYRHGATHRGMESWLMSHRISYIFVFDILLFCLCSCTVVKSAVCTLRSTDHLLPLKTDSRVLYEPGAEHFAEQLSGSLVQAIEQVETGHYRPFIKPVAIHICASEESYTRLTGLRAPASITLKGLFFSPRLVKEQRPLPLYLAHELSHLHLEQQIGRYRFAEVPAWLKEGLATLVSRGGGAQKVTDQQALESIAGGSHFVPHEEGGIFFRKYATPLELTHHMFYRQRMLFVRYLRSLDEDKYRTFLLSVQDGARFARAFDDGFGVAVSEVRQQFLESVNRELTSGRSCEGWEYRRNLHGTSKRPSLRF